MEQVQEPQKKPRSFYLLIAAMLFQGLSGLAGGLGLVLDPSGRSLSIPFEWLDGSPFDSYFIPGLILLIALGAFPLFVTYGIWHHRSWSRLAALLVGFMLIIWIVVEILVIGYQPAPPLQFIYGLLGLTIIALVLFPALRHYMNQQAS